MSPDLRVARVKVERRNDATIADTPTPRLSWLIETTAATWWQQSAEVRLDGRDVVVLDIDESSFVAWPFPPLTAHARPSLEVRVTGRDGRTSPWSDPIEVSAGFLAPGEWEARYIAAADRASEAAPVLLRTEFDLAGQTVTGATLYATAHGAYQVEINGRDVDDAVLKPGWTAYGRRLLHEATSVADLLVRGSNAIGVRLAGGWWTERFGFGGTAERFYGAYPDVAAQLFIEFSDGSSQVVTTGPGWRSTDGPLRASSLYQGERIDARCARPGWSRAGYDDSAWAPVRLVDCDDVPEPAFAEPVRRTDEIPVQQVITTPSGATVLDFGQNLVGRIRARITGPAGHTVTIRHAEVLEHGEICTRPLRNATATDELVLSGGEDVFEPEFTFHGFRYAEVSNWPFELDPAAITAVVVGSDMRRTAWFDSSHPLVNQLHANAVWGMRGNFVSLPTDCPQRDERLGWTGDIVGFSAAACLLFDADAFLASWLRDLALEQAGLDGICPAIVPCVLPDFAFAAAGWGDAACIVPMDLYHAFGDRRALADQYPSMKAWAEAILRLTHGQMLWEGDYQFGDWLDPKAPPDDPGDARTDPDIAASAYLFHSVALVAKAASLLGFDEDAAHFRAVADDVRTAWVKAYVTATGRIVSDTQTAYTLAIRFGLVDGENRSRMGKRLAALVRRRGYRIATGFLGTPHIQDALTDTGHAAVARRLLLQTASPSWLYPVSMGATTSWERWDAMLPDGTINRGEMTSFNHYSQGAVVDWLQRRIGGIEPTAPGHRSMRISPLILAGFNHAAVRRETPYGTVDVSWAAEGSVVTVRAVIPPNTNAVVELPGVQVVKVGSGSHEWAIADPRPEYVPHRLSVESPMGDLLDDEEAHAKIMAALDEADPTAAHFLRDISPWLDTRSIPQVFQVANPVVLDTVQAVLDQLNQTRFPNEWR